MGDRECGTSFNQIKQDVVVEVQLNYPRTDSDFCIIIDASVTRTAAILYQNVEGKRLIIGFSSKTLKPCESKYTITELEFLALIYAIRKWRKILVGHKLNVYTDHEGFKHFRSIKYWNNRLYRWNLEIQDLDIIINFIPGASDVLADALSRLSAEEPVILEINLFCLVPQELSQVTPFHWNEEQRKDDSLKSYF